MRDSHVKTKKRNRITLPVVLMVLYDFIAVHAAYFLALWGRFDFIFSNIPQAYFNAYRYSISIYAVLCIFVFLWFHLYRSIWRYASYTEFTRVFASSGLLSVVYSIVITLVFTRMPLTYYFWGMILQFLFILGMRFSYRTWLFAKSRVMRHVESQARIMVIGAAVKTMTARSA